MRIEVTVKIIKEFASLQTETLAIETPNTEHIQHDVNLLTSNAYNMFNALVPRFSNLGINQDQAIADKVIADKAIASMEQNNKASYEYQNEITELKKALARKECQTDGLIKGMNKSYVATPDENNPVLLEGVEKDEDDTTQF